jgi:hypothetical protein
VFKYECVQRLEKDLEARCNEIHERLILGGAVLTL